MRITAPIGSTNWVNSRVAAFEAADLLARNDMARTVGTLVQSSRELLQAGSGGEEAPPEVATARNELSNAERLRTLTGLALDEAIRRYNPTWNGAGKTEEQRRAEAVKVHAAIRQTIATHAAVVVSGAMTPIQFEGLDADGHLSVLVGMVWSDRQQRLAEGMWNPELPSRTGTPGLSAR